MTSSPYPFTYMAGCTPTVRFFSEVPAGQVDGILDTQIQFRKKIIHQRECGIKIVHHGDEYG